MIYTKLQLMLCDITIMVCFLNEEGLDMAGGDQDFIWVVLTEQTEFQARSVNFWPLSV